MARYGAPLSPALLRQLDLHGPEGAEIARRLEAAQLRIAAAEGCGRFAPPRQRLEARRQKAQAGRALEAALAEARLLLETPAVNAPPEARRIEIP
ncbi:MAG: hypothetical protein EP318_14775 [Rhodobacteraceae bacterium]|nr:MAG: hypothetical protein EP318_14775 [Paracoccaceae bacterium]